MGGKWRQWGELTVDEYGKTKPEYSNWRNIISRVGIGRYSEVSCSERFKQYNLWIEWASNQKGFRCVDNLGRTFHIDKDIIGDGTLYDFDTCCFVPNAINSLFRKPRIDTGLLLGVSKEVRKKKFKARGFNLCGGSTHIGYYDTEGEAHDAYLKTRLLYVASLVEIYGDNLEERLISELYKSCKFGYRHKDIITDINQSCAGMSAATA